MSFLHLRFYLVEFCGRSFVLFTVCIVAKMEILSFVVNLYKTYFTFTRIYNIYNLHPLQRCRVKEKERTGNGNGRKRRGKQKRISQQTGYYRSYN